MATGLFITFEGLDGSGKTTQMRRLAARLAADPGLHGRGVTTLRQPGSTALGDRIRALLLDSKSESELGPIDPTAELTLMFADRAQAIAEVVRPAMERGEIVLCDRFTDSSEAYQGGGRKLGSACVLALDAAVCGGLQPDLTLLLLPPLEVALSRARRRNGRNAGGVAGADEGRFERETDLFYRRIHAKYLEIAAREPGRVVTIVEDGGIASIEAKIFAVVMARLTTAVPDATTGADTIAEARL